MTWQSANRRCRSFFDRAEAERRRCFNAPLRQGAGRRCWARRCADSMRRARADAPGAQRDFGTLHRCADAPGAPRNSENPALQQGFCPPASLVLHAVLDAKTMQNLAHERAVVLLGVAPQAVAALVLDARRLAELRRPRPGLLKNVIVSAGRREGGGRREGPGGWPRVCAQRGAVGAGGCPGGAQGELRVELRVGFRGRAGGPQGAGPRGAN